MFDIVLSLAPIFALIMLGYALKHLAWVPEDFWASAERMTYYIFFPALLISNTAKAIEDFFFTIQNRRWQSKPVLILLG